MEATLNIRLDSNLKNRGNAVLAAAGIGVSDAVRALWEEMAATQRVPEFCSRQAARNDEKARKRALIKDFAAGSATPYSAMSDEELRDAYMAQFA